MEKTVDRIIAEFPLGICCGVYSMAEILFVAVVLDQSLQKTQVAYVSSPSANTKPKMVTVNALKMLLQHTFCIFPIVYQNFNRINYIHEVLHAR